jgi:cleavage and polyadenylation specificity factor subunit 2
MDTVRTEGNVLIPVETASRTLELIHILGQYWTDAKLFGLYHLVLLSPMGSNVLEFTRSELEWMSDSVSKGFYLGKPNPFHFPQMHVCSSLKELGQIGPGPKVS